MNPKVLHTLEYTKIIDRLASLATSEPGRMLCKALVPMTDLSAIEEAQTQTADALGRLFAKGATSFGGNRDLGRTYRTLEAGGTLSAGELLHIAAQLENTARIKTYGKSGREDAPRDSLSDLFDRLEPLTNLVNEINRCLPAEDEVADDASPALKKIRRQIALTNDRIHTQLNALVNGSARTYLQDAVVTLRGDRYCIPVKAEYKGQVPGLVHDQSASGSTYFIEPAAVVNLNNELKELALQEEKEIEKIFAELSAQAGEHTEALMQNQALMTELDFIFARASLAMEQKATRPVFHTDRHIRIRQGRHPLLDQKTAVPIDIALGADFDLLVITGPNTGGKTVSLKTLGLLTLMGQSGLHIPAGDRSELSVFTEVYADIGDEQSIEQNLSTFSSHMATIVSILAHADENSLCLFDELGAGTDPTEGAALAEAILDFLHCRGIRTAATTHYSELKVYALSTDFVENACCEFDVETLRPTYRLLMGIPGKSNAFAISARLGLSDEIIDSAKSHITADQESFEDLLADLESKRISIEKESLDLADRQAALQEREMRVREKEEKLDRSKEKILREANEEARDILQEAKDVADETIRSFQKSGTQPTIQEMEKSREKVRKQISEKSSRLSQKQTAPTHKALKPSQIHLGDTVRILSMDMKGTVSTLPDQKGKLYVQCGILRTQTNIDDLALVSEETVSMAGRPVRTKTSRIGYDKSQNVSGEINLLGRHVDDAIQELDKYLDDAYLAHLPSVRIVHGKGTGALRSAVQEHLRHCSYIKSYRLGEYGEGDAGVTIAEFK